MGKLGDLAKLINTASKQEKVENKFLRELERTMETMDEAHAPSKTYKPSSLGGCGRSIYFQLTGAEMDNENDDSNLVGICESGTDRHERLQTWVSKMKEAGFDCEWVDVKKFLEERPVAGTKVIKQSGMETKCFNEILNMSFLCDGIIKYEGKYYILEIKTESLYKFQNQTGPFVDHIVQATCYSICLGIDEIIFIYEDRNLCSKKSYLVEISEEMKQELVIGKIEEIDGYVKAEKVPPKSNNPKDCTYCAYKTICKTW